MENGEALNGWPSGKFISRELFTAGQPYVSPLGRGVFSPARWLHQGNLSDFIETPGLHVICKLPNSFFIWNSTHGLFAAPLQIRLDPEARHTHLSEDGLTIHQTLIDPDDLNDLND